MNRLYSLVCILLFVFPVAAFPQDLERDLKVTTSLMHGSDVLELQKRLLFLGFNSVGNADGWYGTKTEKAVTEYQALLSLKQNGIVDRKLWSLLFPSDPVMNRINGDLKVINELTIGKYVKTESDVSDYSAEGGSKTTYNDNGKVKYAEIEIFGEMGKVYYRVFPVQDRYLVVSKFYRYPAMFDLKHARLEVTTHYYVDKLIYEIRDGELTKLDENPTQIPEILKEK